MQGIPYLRAFTEREVRFRVELNLSSYPIGGLFFIKNYDLSQPILIVDDDQTSNFVTSMIIRRVKPDVKIVTALNGMEAVNYFENSASLAPQYVLLDINMPVMNGFEFLNWLNDHPDIVKPKVIMYTSSVREEDRKEAERYNAVIAYVEKPLNNEVFEKILSQH